MELITALRSFPRPPCLRSLIKVIFKGPSVAAVVSTSRSSVHAAAQQPEFIAAQGHASSDPGRSRHRDIGPAANWRLLGVVAAEFTQRGLVSHRNPQSC